MIDRIVTKCHDGLCLIETGDLGWINILSSPYMHGLGCLLFSPPLRLLRCISNYPNFYSGRQITIYLLIFLNSNFTSREMQQCARVYLGHTSLIHYNLYNLLKTLQNYYHEKSIFSVKRSHLPM